MMSDGFAFTFLEITSPLASDSEIEGIVIKDRIVDASPCIVIMFAMAHLVVHGYPALKLVA
jgi:hypothetical protein